MRVISKGIEIDVVSEVRTGKEKVWDNVMTYFAGGKYGESQIFSVPQKLGAIQNARLINEWHLPAANRFRFARISGDINGIHYSSLYDRMLGFERDSAQPIRVIARCISCLPGLRMDRPLRLDFYLKGPVYYESTLILKNQEILNGNRFNVYRKGNDKPCIEGKLSTV
jgi:hypothetical protein